MKFYKLSNFDDNRKAFDSIETKGVINALHEAGVDHDYVEIF